MSNDENENIFVSEYLKWLYLIKKMVSWKKQSALYRNQDQDKYEYSGLMVSKLQRIDTF